MVYKQFNLLNIKVVYIPTFVYDPTFNYTLLLLTHGTARLIHALNIPLKSSNVPFSHGMTLEPLREKINMPENLLLFILFGQNTKPKSYWPLLSLIGFTAKNEIKMARNEGRIWICRCCRRYVTKCYSRNHIK